MSLARWAAFLARREDCAAEVPVADALDRSTVLAMLPRDISTGGEEGVPFTY